MTKEDIQLALRLVAHGRVNHPQVEELAEKLAALLAPKPIVISAPAGFELPTPEEVAATPPGGVIPLKRGPGRPKKAE